MLRFEAYIFNQICLLTSNVETLSTLSIILYSSLFSVEKKKKKV